MIFRLVKCLLFVATLVLGNGVLRAADLPSDWSAFWSRQAGDGSAAVDPAVRHNQQPAIRVEHRGQGDWSLARRDRLKVQEGDILELAAFVKVDGAGSSGISVTAYDQAGAAINWQLGQQSARASADWQALSGKVVVPAKVVSVLPRFTGNGPSTVWMEGFSCKLAGSIKALRDANVPASLTIENQAISILVDSSNATFKVTDRRNGQVWAQRAGNADLVLRSLIKSPAKEGDGLELKLLHVPSGLDISTTLRLDAQRAELSVEIAGQGVLPSMLVFPHPFVTEPGTDLIVPINEGISYPVDDASIGPMHLVAYGGHGICMGFWGVSQQRGGRGHMAIIETPDDAIIAIDRIDRNLCITPQWQSQKGQFGYARRLRYVFFDQGGHVAMCKRYRDYAQQIGLLKTFTQKRQQNPNIDLLIGAANVWCWDKDSVGLVGKLQAAGIGRILWSAAASPEKLRAMNDLGVLTSRYDIYQDVMNPDNFKLLRGIHADWTTEAWPKDLMLARDGQWIRGWEVTGKDGKMYPCGVTCDKQAIAYADKRIPAELAKSPYRCRFIDTTTASPWRECYDPAHPLTRSESRQYKMKLLELVSQKYKLVTGCETGHEAAVPYVDYFEGMLSLGQYRVPDSGRNMAKILDDVPPRVAKFQVGQQYRLPLWELVYHDCVVAQWYWGDYNNKLPSLWDKRDLFNALYGTPPMFMFSADYWEKNRDRFVKSYQATAPIARATGYSQMTDHRYLTADRSVQQTTFANGVAVTVNFGDGPFKAEDGTTVAPLGMKVVGIK